MPIPLPEFPLTKSHCSVLFDNTIYAFTEDAFQSLKIEKGAEWEELPLLFGTKGAACVHAHHGTPNEALYIVGGLLSNTTISPSNGFMGLQRYVFGAKKWESLKTPDPVLYNVTNHAAIFIESSQQIFTFAGTRWPDEGLSTMTFLISTSEPFVITSIPTAWTPPMTAPLILPWGNDGALVLATGDQNTNLYTYTPSGVGWAELPAKLPNALPPRGNSGAAIMEGGDGSRMLYTFDMSVSPIRFAQLLVKEGNGVNLDADKNLTATNWPKYDGSLAPSGPRDGFAFASEGSHVVFTGGVTQDPICMFNAAKNRWINTTALFGEDGKIGTSETHSASGEPIPLPSPTQTSTPTSAGANTKVSSLKVVWLLFAVLGSLLAVALLLWLLLRLLRKIKARRKEDDPNRMSFQDRGVDYMKEAGLARRLTNRMKRGGASAAPPKNRGMDNDDLAAGSNRGSGWSKYFSSSNSATNLVDLPSRTYSNATRSSSVYDIEYMASNTTRYPYHSGASGILPLNVDSNGIAPPPTAGSTRSAGLTLDLPGTGLGVDANYFSTTRKDSESERHHKEIGRRVSDMTISSAGQSSYSSGIPESIAEKAVWSPVDGQGHLNHHHEQAHVLDSPRGFGVLMTENRASSVYPESAVTVWPDGNGNRKGDHHTLEQESRGNKHAGNGEGNFNGISNDMSWLNLKQ